MPRPRGPLTVLLLRLGAVAAVLFLQRVLFFLLNRDAFPSPPLSAFLGGMRFDGSVIGWLWLPWLALFLVNPFPKKWFRSAQQVVFLTITAVAFFFNCVDMGYYRFTLKRSTADLFDIMTAGGDVVRLAPDFVADYWYIVLVFAGSLALVWWAYVRLGGLSGAPARSWIWRIGWRAIALVGMFLLGRGGVQYIPLGILHAGNYASPAYFPVVLNTPFTIMTSLGKPVVTARSYMPPQQADALWPVVHTYQDDLYTVAERPNVVVIMLESFSAEYSSQLTGGTGYMPFLDSLMRSGLCATKAYANGRRSIDAVPAVVASIPELMDEAFLTSPYAQVPFTSMANILAQEGYRTLFMHGGNNGTMSFDTFARSAGYAEYHGRDEYPGPEDDIGVWGVRDAPYLRHCAEVLDRTPQPFHATIFTLSSHHPYRLPPEDAARFSEGTVLPIQATLRYTDDALRTFFQRAERSDWGGNTLFVLTADHTADLLQDGKMNSGTRDYWVPLVYYMPEHLEPASDARVTQHIDILPTVLDLIGYHRPFFSFGHSSVRREAAPYAATARDHLYLLMGDGHELYFDGERVAAFLPNAADSDTLALATRDSLALDMGSHLKALVQQFTTHLTDHQLVAPSASP